MVLPTNKTPELLGLVANRFKALSDRARLQLLQALRDGPRTVSDLVQETGMGQANVSRHLTLLHSSGFVSRERDGLFVRYALADNDVLTLCDLVCGRLEAEITARQKIVGDL
jgi:DNA-binding transcriptional ArsR family regulator